MKKILERGRNCWDVTDVTGSGLLVDARDFYKAFYETARRAVNYILLAGWQFDSEVRLLHRGDMGKDEEEVRLLPFLKQLCAANRNLRVLILAWDFSILFAEGREWFQDLLFSDWGRDGQIHFRFDGSHAVGASHHRKLVVIDGVTAFVGGMDLCEKRWDDRRHLRVNPDRVDTAGQSYEAVHDIQSCIEGKAAERLADLFGDWWCEAGGGSLDLPAPEDDSPVTVTPTLPLSAREVAISRTQARTLVPAREPAREIRQLYGDAIEAAESLIYIENQFFTSRAVHDALVERMNRRNRSRLRVIVMLPRWPHSLLERISLVAAQTMALSSLRDTAARNGHDLGIYSLQPQGRHEKDAQTYIHSKLLIVDDRFLTVGSANLTNRSMGLDTELNVAWETNSPREQGLIKSIRRARESLLAEHTGAPWRERRRLRRVESLISELDGIAARPGSRLLPHSADTGALPVDLLSQMGETFTFDPEEPLIEEAVHEFVSREPARPSPGGLNVPDKTVPGRSDSGATRDTDRTSTASSDKSRLKVLVMKSSFFQPALVRRLVIGAMLIGAVLTALYLLLF